jgi:four helix bundle protein
MKYELQKRLNEFGNSIMNLSKQLPRTGGAQYLASQLSKSGITPALKYGEIQTADSRNDLISKMKLLLKELREIKVCLKMIERRAFVKEAYVNNAMQENHELVSIFVRDIARARKIMH